MQKKIFGTDGIRGTANRFPMTPEMILSVGRAIAQVFLEKNKKEKHRIVIGKDTRLSGYMVESALTSGICSMGVNVLLVGPMPTPAIAHLTKSLNADAGIVLSASHNPAKDNGIKIFDERGFKLPDEIENRIEKLVFSRHINSDNVNGDKIGKAFRIDDARGRYIEFAKSTVKSQSLSGLRIVLDCANGAAYNIAPTVFGELGAEVLVLNNKPDGLNINKNCGALFPEIIQKEVKKHKADIGLALDGDGDRIIICDEKGQLIDGDCIVAMCALDLNNRKKLKQNTVVTTIMANKGLDIAMEKNGINVVKTKVGDRYILEEMRKKEYNFGGEPSGHIIFGDYTTTGDGIITALQVLRIVKNTGKKLSVLKNCMSKMPQVLINVNVKQKTELEKMPKVIATIKKAELKLGNAGRVLVRYSGTENIARVMVEGDNKKKIADYAKEIANQIKRQEG